MGKTRIEQAIDEIEPLGDEDIGCDDIRLAWLADELGAEDGGEFDGDWCDR